MWLIHGDFSLVLLALLTQAVQCIIQPVYSVTSCPAVPRRANNMLTFK